MTSDPTLRVTIADAIFTCAAVINIDDAYHAADAVLRDLRLRREQCPCSQRGPNCAHRYVTPWRAL